LDLFAGSGALGIEALSRGASEAVFCDNSREAGAVLLKNLEKLGETNFRFLNKDFKEALKALRGEKFSIIFLDPPYDKEFYDKALALIADYDLLEDDGVVVCETRAAHPRLSSHIIENLREESENTLAVYDSRQYGTTQIQLVKKCSVCLIPGSFSPFTKGHLQIVEEALESYDVADVIVFTNPEKSSPFKVEARLDIIKDSLGKLAPRVNVGYDKGFVSDYCKKNAITHIVKGIRNSADELYENAQSLYNKEYGNATTEYVYAKKPEISSSAFWQTVKIGGDYKGLIAKNALITVRKHLKNINNLKGE
jgi:16S rRNA (guanine(966)-N(2))-methyltransferase RsmD/pantetheine-phosphate adenylyltransferase